VRLENSGATVWRAAYDGNGVRRKRLDSNGTIHYVSGVYEHNAGNGLDTTEVVTKYYHALGRLIAFRKNGTLRWVGTDHLGGTIRVATATVQPVASGSQRYKPFGHTRESSARPMSPPRVQKRAARLGSPLCIV
jgi:hypothetical protein